MLVESIIEKNSDSTAAKPTTKFKLRKINLGFPFGLDNIRRKTYKDVVAVANDIGKILRSVDDPVCFIYKSIDSQRRQLERVETVNDFYRIRILNKSVIKEILSSVELVIRKRVTDVWKIYCQFAQEFVVSGIVFEPVLIELNGARSRYFNLFTMWHHSEIERSKINEGVIQPFLQFVLRSFAIRIRSLVII
jgi:hypothetical protein